MEPARVAGHVDAEGALAHELVADAGEVVGDDALALLEQDVDVTRLRNALSRRGAVREAIALDEQHDVEVVGQDPGREKPGEASADHDCTAARTPRGAPSPDLSQAVARAPIRRTGETRSAVE